MQQDLTPVTYEESLKATLEYFQGENLPSTVWIDKYNLKDSLGNLYETIPDDMHWRLAEEFSRGDQKYPNPLLSHEYYKLLKDFTYLVPQGSPMAGIGNNLQIVSISNCLRGDTKVLTRTGYKKIKHLSGQTINIMTKGGGWVDAPFKNYGKQQLYKIELIKGKTSTKTLYATKDHDWFIYKKGNKLRKKSTENLQVGELLESQFGKSWSSYKPSAFGIAHGISYGDGHTINNVNHANNITLCADSKVLSKYFIDDCTSKKDYICNGGADYYGSLPNFFRELPNIMENKSYLYGWLAGYFAADGCIDTRGCVMLNSVDKFNMEFVQDVCGVLGISCSDVHQQTSISNLTNKEHTTYKVIIHSKFLNESFFILDKHKKRYNKNTKNPPRWKIKSIEKTDIIEDVFCAEVPETTSFVIEGNILSGNCFVIGNEGPSDSYGAILKIDEEQIQLMKRRGGVGSDVSNIRPANSPVKNSALTSTGIVPFMERRSTSTREVAQAGRRGAKMISIIVTHPQTEDFIDAKMEQGMVTGANISVKLTDNFMEIVDRTEQKDVDRFLELEKLINEEYQDKKVPKKIEKEFNELIDKICFTQYFDHIDGTRQTQSIVAKALWDKLMHNAWKSAEPGVLFWDTITKESLAEHYPGFANISTNPCLTGETMVAVADGRGNVSIKDLAEEGKDVPVYAYNNEGKIVVKLMRNPRLTGTKEKVYKLTLDDGSIIRATENHKFKTRSGEYKRMDALKNGDSLYIMSRYKEAFKNVTYRYDSKNSNNSDYWWISGGGSNKSEHRLISQYHYGNIKSGYVVHHKDHNSLNNNINNLELMSVKEHNKYHANLIKGENNPYHKMTDEWKHNFASMPGETNPNYSGISNEQIKNEILEKTKSLGRVMSVNEYQKLAREKGLSLMFSKWRKENLGELKDLLSWAADICEVLNEDLHPNVLKRYKEAIDNGYKPYIDTNSLTDKIKITKKCEICGNDFSTDYGRREYAVCSNECSKRVRINSFKKTISNKDSYHSEKTKQKFEKERIKKREQQAKIVSDLRFSLQRDPKIKEFIEEAKKQNIVYRIGKNSPFKNWTELKEASLDYNHKVVSIEFDGYEDVYNGTVDEFHNFFVGGFESKTKNNKQKFTYINNLNCGEIPLCAYDSCRLSCINLYSYVENKFTSEAFFNFELFKKHTHIHQRMMDNIVDLELEKIDTILNKIKNDPESDDIKYRELKLWEKVKEKCELGRRTGSGVTGEGDMLAAMNLRYGTPEATKFAEEVHKVYAIETLRSSVQLAKERGAFPIFDNKYEEGNPFIARIEKEDPELIKEMYRYGRRNIALLTIAPCGSVSILTQTTSGVECAFMINYTRRRKINPSDKNTRVDFVDEVGDSWQNYNVFHKGFIDWFEVNQRRLRSEIENIDLLEIEEKYTWNECKLYLENLEKEKVQNLIEKSPYYKATSNDVDWVEKVRMQGAIQKWVDHSISCCLTKDSLIETDKGLVYLDEIMDIKEIPENEFLKNDTCDLKVFNHELKKVPIDAFYNNGQKEIWKLKLENDLILKSTYNERVLVYNEETEEDEWKEVSLLEIGDLVKIK